MRPKDDHIGEQLTYGIDGSCSLNIDSLMDQDGLPYKSPAFSNKTVFSTAKHDSTHPHHLNVKPGSFHVVVPLQIHSPHSDYVTTTSNSTNLFVPADLTHRHTNKPKLTFIDPCYGNLISCIDVFDGTSRLIASASGVSGSVVAFSLIDLSKRESLDTTYAFSTDARIEQIELINVSTTVAIVGVRTSESVYLLRFKFALHAIVNIQRIDKIDQSKVASRPLAHFSISSNMLGIVDIDGNFQVFRLSLTPGYYSCIPVELNFRTINDPADFSNFKRIVFNGRERFYVFSRNSLHEYNLKSQALKCRVIAGAWSRIMDMIPLNDSKGKYLMLTSKEIILVDTSKGFKRLLAWKHYLTEEDTSWKLIPVSMGNLHYTCLINSNLYDFVYAIEIDTSNSPSIVDDPYYILMHPSSPLQTICVINTFTNDTKKHFVCYMITAQLEIATCKLRYTAARTFTYPTNNKSKKIIEFNPRDNIFSLSTSSLTSNDIPLHDHQIDISQNIKSFLTSNASILIPFTHCDFNFISTDVSQQLQRMISQCKHPGLLLKEVSNIWLTSCSVRLKDLNADQHVSQFWDQLKGVADDSILKFLELYLPLSLITLHKEVSKLEMEIDKDTQKICTGLPKDIRYISDSFLTDMELPSRYDDNVDSLTMSQLGLSNITESQKRGKVSILNSQRAVVKEVLPQVKLSQPVVSSQGSESQSQSKFEMPSFSLSQRRKPVTKKRRKTGFL